MEYRSFIGRAYINFSTDLRKTPEFTSKYIDTNPEIKKDTLVEILDYSGSYIQVRRHTQIGWVTNSFLNLVCDCCLGPFTTKLDDHLKLIDYFKWAEEHKKLFHPKIIIGRYEFQLLYIINGEDELDYKKIRIRNNSQQQIYFTVYPSNSQGNIYRFCSQDDGTHLYKGNDYVAETFIHMDLQKFIYENISKLKLLPHRECDNVNTVIPAILITYKDYMDRRLDKFDDEFIKIISRLTCGDGFSHTYKILGNMIDIFNASSRILSDTQRARLILEITFILRSIDKGKDESQIEREFNELYRDLLKKNTERKDSGLSNTIKYNIMTYYLAFISKYLDDNYSIIFETITKLFNTGDILMEKYKYIQLNSTFYSVIIQNKKNNLKYTIIYAKYNYRNSSISTHNGNYTILLNIIPHGADRPRGDDINSLGLYKKYTTMGIYLCKPFDYVSQVKTMAPGAKSDNDYHFLGHVYHNLFPVKQITEYEKK
jgi:hypothetical protein